MLLDEMLPRKLKRLLPENMEVMTVQERGWDSLENGQLLTVAQGEFDVLLTTDRGIPYQQDLSRFGLAVVVLSARSNRLEHLEPLMAEVGQLFKGTGPTALLAPGSAVRIDG